MPFDAKLANRIRPLLKGRKGVTEKEMFGGLAFLRDGQMFVAIVDDELMARVGKEAHTEWVVKKGARIMDFTGKPMAGFIFVEPHGVAGALLSKWVEGCWKHVATVKKPEETVKKPYGM